MFSRDLASSSSKDAIDGFDAIANALDRGLDTAESKGSRIGDFLAIAAGWLVLGAIILYPSLQLAAIVICAAFLGTRSCARLILGPSPTDKQQLDRQRLLAA
ncbi:hypothetical protein [Bradyrhizobium icense]|uniref:Uncharacterized protein n=1 Tax=Bradyrhizobium icense TaxID=1274631 RepID=A0A1B1UCA0_9BRAD|nr:hypothetical protein [Bradyrhizobium icense]ANW00385.1 hypothetical protein LMTR13_09610 [Bradyrhizobium icense]